VKATPANSHRLVRSQKAWTGAAGVDSISTAGSELTVLRAADPPSEAGLLDPDDIAICPAAQDTAPTKISTAGSIGRGLADGISRL